MITSTSNRKVKEVQVLNRKASYRRECGLYTVEGIRMFREAPEPLVEQVYVSEGFFAKCGDETRQRISGLPHEFVSDLGNKPMLVEFTADWCPNCKFLESTVYTEKNMAALKKRYGLTKLGAIVPGGNTGQMSIYNGLKAAAATYGLTVSCGEEESKSASTNELLYTTGFAVERNIVLIHDGVRPLIDEKIISDNISAVKKYGSAITCTPATETVILVGDEAVEETAGETDSTRIGETSTDSVSVKNEKTAQVENHVTNVPDRSRSRFAKAPQSFFLDDILEVEERAISEGKTNMIDSCTLMKEYGYPLHTVIGPYYNIKITTPEDFIIYRALYDAIENDQL